MSLPRFRARCGVLLVALSTVMAQTNTAIGKRVEARVTNVEGGGGRLRFEWPFDNRFEGMSFDSVDVAFVLEPGGGLRLHEHASLRLRDLAFHAPLKMHFDWVRCRPSSTLEIGFGVPLVEDSETAVLLNRPYAAAGEPHPSRRHCIAQRSVVGEHEFIESRVVKMPTDGVVKVSIEIEIERVRVVLGADEPIETKVPAAEILGISFRSHLGANVVRNLVVEARPLARSIRRLAITAAARRHAVQRSDLYRRNQANVGGVDAVIRAMQSRIDQTVRTKLSDLCEGLAAPAVTPTREVITRFELAVLTLEQQTKEETPDDAVIDSALATMQEITKVSGNPPEMQYFLARRLSELDRHDEAIAIFRGLIEYRKTDASSRAALTLLHLSAGSLTTAANELARWAVLDGRSLEPRIVDALLNMGAGRFDVARLIAERAARKIDDPALTVLVETLRRLEAGPFGGRCTQIQSAHYVVDTDLPKTEAQSIVDRLERYRSVLEGTFPLPDTKRAPSRVMLFASVESFRSFTGALAPSAEHALGFYVPTLNTLFLFATLDDERDDLVLHHEAFHQYLDCSRRWAPIWLDEGMAEYFAAPDSDKSTLGFGGVQGQRLIVLKRAFSRGEVLPLAALIRMSRQRFMDRKTAHLNYAQSWAAVHFFRSGVNPALTRIFEEYVAAVIAGASSRQAWQSSFARIEDWTEIEAEWRRYVDGLHDTLLAEGTAR